MYQDRNILEEAFEWDIENWSRASSFWDSNSSLNFPSCRALELGANQGGLSLLLALKGAAVVCSDLNGPEQKARDLHEKYKVSENISYHNVNALEIPFPDSSFDLVAYKSVLGAMRTYDNQKKMASEIFRVLKPSGELWFAENLVGSPIHMTARKLFVTWGTRWRYVTIKELNELFEPFGRLKIKPYGFGAAFGRREWQRNLLGKLDSLFNFCLPDSWKYIAFGLVKNERT